jgi:hypothetical protein
MKKIIITSIVLSSMLLSGVAFAQTSGNTTTPTSTPTQTRKDCVLSAIDARNAAPQQAKDTFKTAQASALQIKKDALLAAKSLTDKTAKKAAIKAANDAYKATVKKNRDDLKNAVKLAKDAYKAAVAACPKI